jgi:hypothetical protein
LAKGPGVGAGVGVAEAAGVAAGAGDAAGAGAFVSAWSVDVTAPNIASVATAANNRIMDFCFIFIGWCLLLSHVW